MILYCFHSDQHSLQQGYTEAMGSISIPFAISFLHFVQVFAIASDADRSNLFF